MKKRLLAILVLLVLAVFALTSCNLFFTPEKPTYKVTFDVDGGSAVETQVITHKETVTRPDAPTKEGHTFDGWYADEKCTTAWDFEKNPITSQTTIYAKWNLNSHTVSFVGAETDGQTVDWGKAPTQPADPTKVGHTFGGWFADEGFQTAFDFTKPIKGDTTVYAKWNINSYTVSFDAEGVASQTVQFGSLATKPTDPTKTGYTFRGWLLGGAAFDFATPITESISLSANWEINKYTITYTDGVDGETVFEDKVFKDVPYGSATPTIADPTRQGYQFNGWDIDVADTVSGDVTYTATWVLVHEHSYTVKNTSAKYLKTEATCTEPAVYYYSCSQCIAKGSETFQHGAPLGHDMGAWTQTKAPTCTETGSEKRDCSRCDHSETRVVDAKGHSYSSVVTAPTCTADGYTTHTCGDCGHSYTDTPVGKLGHNMGQWTQTKAPTCTDKGTEKRSCTRCSHFETRDVEALKHSFTTYVYNNDATCTEDGTETAKCDRCDETHTRTKANTKLDHTYSTTEKNDTHHWTKCSCGATTTKVAHDFGDWTYANDQHTHTCETAGCGHSVSVKCSGGTATCKDKAVCSTCGNEYGSIDPNGHTWTDGKFLCSNDYCERAYTATLVTNTTELKAGDKIIIVANEYDFALSTQQNSNNRGQAPVTKNGNIVVYGETTQIIVLEAGSAANTFAFKVDDGYLYAAGGTAKNNYLKTTADLTVTSSWTVEISAEGVATIKSADASVVRNTLMYNSSNKIFSCYASGQTEVSIYVINEGMSGIKHEHTYEEKETKPDCTNDGYITKTCACGDIVTEDGDPATNHADAKHTPKVPGCDFDGVNEYWYCSKCETYFSDKEYKNVIEDLDAWKTGEGKIAKHGHSYVDGFCEHCGRDENAKVYEWILVTDATELKADDRIIIVANGYDFALGTTQNSNNRSSTAISKIDNKVIINGDVQIIVLVEGTVDNTFGFQVGEKYLYAASSSSNYLRSGTLNDNASWSIQIDDNGVATIVASGTNTRNTLQYNQSNNLFSCYGGSTQKGVSIYVEREEGYKPAEKYTIKFVDEDGTLISEKIYTEGSTVEIPENPTKAATAQYTYTFAGWDKTVTTVTGDVTYTATYTSVTNKYTVTFVNGEETLQSSEVEYGTVPTYTGKTPTKEATAQYTYTFSGWDKELTAVIGDVTYTAEFSATTNKYVVEFVTNGGSSVASQAVDYNGNATRPEDPTKDGFNFAGWYVDKNLEIPFNFSSAITTATTIYAKWSEKEIPKYIVTFKNGDTTLLTIEVEENQIPVYTGETPEKAETAQYTYIFAGWNETLVAATEDATYTAKFTETVRKYTVTFKNGDEVLQTSEVEYGTVPTYTGKTPEKTETAQYTYTFAGWDVTPVAVTGNATYTATFTETVRTYTVQFVEADGTVISSETYNYGDTVVAPTPTKEGFTFNGWDKEVATTVTGSATYTATWTENVVGGVTTNTVTLQYTASSTTNMDGNGTNNAGIVGLDTNIFTVTANKGGNNNNVGLNKDGTIRLYYAASGGNELTVTSQKKIVSIVINAKTNYNNFSVHVGGETVTGTNGKFDIDAYSFTIRNANTSNVQVHITSIEITYETNGSEGGETPEPETKYTVNFYDDTVDGSPYASETVKNGETVTRPADPEKEGYTFKHWALNGVVYDFTAPVTGNIDLVAVWEEAEQPETPAEKWELVTDASTLKAGDKIIIVANSDGIIYALGSDVGNYRKNIEIVQNSDGSVSINNDVQIITLGTEGGYFVLIVGEGLYLTAPGNNNYLKTGDTIDKSSTWNITISNGNASIVSNTEGVKSGTSRNTIMYNSSSPRFSCYASGQTAVSIYKLTTGSGEPEQPEVCEHELTAHDAKAATCTEAGNTAYWYCEVCEKYFSDENAENEIALADTVIAIDANAHNYGAWTSNGNGTHSRACAHNNQHVESESCSGGTATCTEKAICAKCESEYGATDTNNHTGEIVNGGTAAVHTKYSCCGVTVSAEHSYTTEKDGTHHWTKCACGHTTDKVAHSDAETDKDHNCDTCGQTVGDHSYDEGVVTTAPTCTKEGVKTFTCNCGHTYTEDVNINPANHVNTTAHEQTDATCTEVGYTAGTYCEDCKTWIDGHAEIEKIPHADGEDNNHDCDACREKNIEGHTSGTAVEENRVDSTCTKEGSYNSVVYCTECGEKLSSETKTIEKKAHTEETIPAVAPGCETTGLTAGTKCSVCGETLVAQTEVAATGHAYGEVSYTWTGVESCTATRACTVCKTHSETANAEIDSETTNATCTAEGKTTYTATFNENWAEMQTKVVEIPVIPHSYDETKWVNDTENHWHACTACGDKKDVEKHISGGAATEENPEKCTVCGYVITPALGHIHTNHLTATEAKAATCTEAGNTAYWSCNCGKYFSDANAENEIAENSWVVSAKNHAYGEATYTWSADGKSCTATRVCGNDANHVETAEATIGSSVTTDSTCTENGTTTYTATFSVAWATTQTTTRDDVAMKDHSYSSDWKHDETNHWHECSCGAKSDEAEHSDVTSDDNHSCDTCGRENVTSHSYNSVVTAPTCTEDGYTTYTCNCGDAYTDNTVDKLGHNYNTPGYYVVVEGVLKVAHKCANDNSHVEYEETPVDTTNPVPVANEADLKTVLGAGYSVKLSANIDLTSAIELTSGQKVTINLNGKTITANWATVEPEDEEEYVVVEVLYISGENTKVTITGEGAMISGNPDTDYDDESNHYLINSVVSVLDKATLNIEGGYYCSYNIGDVIFAKSGSNVYISGGKFEAKNALGGMYFVLDTYDKGLEDENTGFFHVSGGTFVNFNPANHTNDGAYTNKVAEGCHSIKNGDNYVVSEHEFTATEAKDATCTEAGNSAYWYCEVCKKYFSDENAENEIEKDSWVISINKENHTGTVVNGGTADVHTKYSCCGTTVSTEHIYTPEKDATYHWTKCDCGHTTEKVEHNHNIPEYDENNHWNECSCGRIDESTVEAHDCKPMSDDSQHWTACDCGYATEKENHTDVLDGDGVICSECNYKYIGEKWVLVTDVNDLSVGTQIIIVATNSNYALSTTQNTNNRSQASVTKNGNTVTFGNDVQIITLKVGTVDGTFAFYVKGDSTGYLYAASGSSNHLKTQATNNDNGSWKITISSNGVATIKAQGTNTRNWLRYNSTNNPPIFSCYGSGQTDVSIYMYVAGVDAPAHEHEGGEATCSSLKSCTICGELYGEYDTTKHNGTKTDAKDPTCTEAGHDAYWQCTDCGKYFSDEDCTVEIEDLAAWKAEGGEGYVPATGHNEELVHETAKDATCMADGNVEYWYCEDCGVYFADEDCTLEIDNPILPKDENAHNYGDVWTSNGDGTHTKTCSHNDEHKVTEDCSSETSATCLEKAVCDDCSTEFGDFGPCVDSDDDLLCDNCGESMCEHEYDESTWIIDGDKHYHQCTVCGDKKDEATHEYSTTLTEGETTHWYACECGAKNGEASHEYTNWGSDASNHWHECACGAKDGETAHAYTTWGSDADKHWHECACGARDGEATHEFDGSSCDVCHYKKGETSWELVTDVTNLKAGDRIVIVANGYSYALSTTQNSNNRGRASVTKSGNTVTFGNDVQIIILEAGTVDGTFAFYVEGNSTGYLYAASSGSNYLRTESKLSANSSWKITIADGVATIVAQGTNSRNTMQYNNSSSLFACYSSASQQAVSIYKETVGEAIPAHDHNTSCVNANGATEKSCEKCGEIFSIQHNYESAVTEPTCDDDGFTTHTCSICGDSYTDSYVDATGHNYVDGKCDNCGTLKPATHTCESICNTCNGCTDAECTEVACADKCECIILMANGAETGKIVKGNTLPSAGAPDGYTFVGWSESTVDETTTEPTIYKVDDEYTGTATTLYAVYTRTETVGGSSSFEKVTEAPTDWSGEYLIVYEAGNVAFNGALTALDAVSNTVSVTISNNTIAATDALEESTFTIAKSGDNYTIQSASEYYIGNTADSNKLYSSTSTKYTNTISINSDGSVHIVGSGKSVLRYNATSGQERFRYFKSTTYTAQKAIYLYKLTEVAGTTTTYYTTNP